MRLVGRHFMQPKQKMSKKLTKEIISVYQGITRRCRLSFLTNSALVYEPKCGGGENCEVPANEYSCTHGAQINFGNLTQYLTYAVCQGVLCYICSCEYLQISVILCMGYYGYFFYFNIQYCTYVYIVHREVTSCFPSSSCPFCLLSAFAICYTMAVSYKPTPLLLIFADYASSVFFSMILSSVLYPS